MIKIIKRKYVNLHCLSDQKSPPNKSAPPNSSSYSTFGSSFLTSFLGYYFLAGAGLSAAFGALLPELDPTFADPALIN